MEIIFNCLFKIDLEEELVTQLPVPEEESDFRSYIITLLGKILEDPDKKGFEFQSGSPEVKTLIDGILNVQNKEYSKYLTYSMGIAQRLMRKEIESQEKSNLKVSLLRGIVVVSFVRLDDGSQRIIISKADYDEFLDALTYANRMGFPLRKKIYKAFVAEFDAENIIKKVAVFDTNSVFTVYWWREFLELREIFNDKFNTESVFDTIIMKVVNPLRKKSKSDHVNLWNATVHYFRVKREFSADGFISDILTDYQPFDNTLKMSDITAKAEKALSSAKFDTKFKIDTSVISKKFKKTIELTSQIELNLKCDIENLGSTIKRFTDLSGNKWVMINSPEGYEYFSDTEIMS